MDIYLFFDTKMTIYPRKVWHVLPSRDVCLRLTAKYLHIDISDQNLKKFEFSVSCYFTCSVLVKFSPLFGDQRLGEEAEDSEVPARGRTRGRLNSRLED